MDDVRRHEDERSSRRDELPPLGAYPEAELALEYVERVRMPPVDVRRRPLLAVRVARLRQIEQLVRRLDHDRALGTNRDRLALAGPEHDRVGHGSAGQELEGVPGRQLPDLARI